MQSHIFLAGPVLALALCSSGWSLASETISEDLPQTVASSVAEVSISVQPAPLEPVVAAVVSGFGVPMASSQLDDCRGGFDLVKNDMQLGGSVANNTAVNVMTGNNYIGEGSFANASGFPMVIQNSGANVLIQNATIINLQYQ